MNDYADRNDTMDNLRAARRRAERVADSLGDSYDREEDISAGFGMDKLDPATEFNEYTRQLQEAMLSGDLPRMTQQEVALLTYVRMGLPVSHAARASGMTTKRASVFLECDPRGREAAEYAGSLHAATIIVTKELLTMQAYEERARSATAGEGLKALEVVAKLHEIGAYAGAAKLPAKGGTIVGEQNVKKVKNKKQLQLLSDDQLLDGADLGYDSFEPEPVDYSKARDEPEPNDDTIVEDLGNEE